MIREITIRPVLNGYICQVGCQHVCFTTREELIKNLSQYLENPAEVESKYLQNAINPMPLQPTIAGDCGQPGRPITARERTLQEAVSEQRTAANR